MWDIETRPDEANKSRCIVVCAKLSTQQPDAKTPSLQSLMQGVDLERAGGMRRATKRDGKWVIDKDDTSSPHLLTRCVEGSDKDAVARAVFEQFLATLDAIEQAKAEHHNWHNVCRWSAAHYLLGEWYFVHCGGEEAEEEEGGECDECDESDDEGASVPRGTATSWSSWPPSSLDWQCRGSY